MTEAMRHRDLVAYYARIARLVDRGEMSEGDAVRALHAEDRLHAREMMQDAREWDEEIRSRIPCGCQEETDEELVLRIMSAPTTRPHLSLNLTITNGRVRGWVACHKHGAPPFPIYAGLVDARGFPDI